MKHTAPKIITMSLVTAFMLGTAAFAQKAENVPTPLQDQQYKTLKKELTNRPTPQKIREQAAKGKLPDVFAKAVQGCTVDGYIFRVPYNLIFDFDELASVAGKDTDESNKSLFYRIVKPAPERTLGVSGTGKFLEALKAMTSGIHKSMQSVAGTLIDEALSTSIKKPLFNDLTALAVKNITKEFKKKYGVTIEISTQKPRQQGGRCEARKIAPPVPVPAPASVPATHN